MDWIVSFRFSWLEPVIYKTAMYLPIMWFGFAPEALFFHAVFGTLIGHLNHANVPWRYGVFGYILNNPKMHLYHHAYDAPAGGQNFGIIFSLWDYLFGTAHVPEKACPKIGFPGDEKVPKDFFGQLIWPLHLVFPKLLPSGTRLTGSIAGLSVVGILYGASLPPTIERTDEPMASSQPVNENGLKLSINDSPETRAALQSFGTHAKLSGWQHPHFAVEASELASALGAKALVILDVRAGKNATERFATGHVPTAQLVYRSDYSGGEIPGVSKTPDELVTFLRAKGVNQDSTLVLMGDGGPEPYRLWWTLREVVGVNARVLNGGLAAWKALGGPLVEGNGRAKAPGQVSIGKPRNQALMLDGIKALTDQGLSLNFVDTRSAQEFDGSLQHRKSTRRGHIPGAEHLDWTDVFKLGIDNVPVLKTPAELRGLWQDLGLSWAEPVVTYCQSGTRSSAVYFALLQAGYPEDALWNYDGSWAEYSRTKEPVAN